MMINSLVLIVCSILFLTLYFLLGAITENYYEWVFGKKFDEDHTWNRILVCLFWPIALPIVIIQDIIIYFRKRLLIRKHNGKN